MAKKEMDQLTKDAVAAHKEGMTYGKYMAMKKPTAIACKPEGYKHTCAFCGKEFYSKTKAVRNYCSDLCREQYYNRIRYEPAVKTCPICGKEFVAKTQHYKYCGAFCSSVAHAQRCRENQQRKKMEANGNG